MYPIHLAIKKIEDKDVLERVILLLLQAIANIEAKNVYGQSPLMYASERCHEEVVQILLRAGADIEGRDKNERTPLIIARKNGHKEIVQALLNAGADAESQDADG